MLDTHRLRVFRAVVATGSINGAAATLGYTSSAVSQQLTALQRETGLTLIEKRGRGIEATAVGLAFADEAGPVLERLDALESVAGDLRAGRVGRIAIRYFASAGAAWIPPIVGAVSREFPLLRFDLRLLELSGDSDLEPDLEVLVAGSPAMSNDQPDPGGYDIETLLEEPYLVVLPVDHPLAGEARIELATLREERWVDNDFSRGPCRQALLTACAAAGFVPTFHIETHDYPSALAFVSVGTGITVLPRLGTVAMPSGVVAVPVVRPVPMRRILLRVKRSVRDHPAVRRAVSLLKEQARATDQPWGGLA